MIEAKLELISAQGRARDRHLGTVKIFNDGSTPADDPLHNYGVEILNSRGVVFRRGTIHAWPRQQKSPMQLLCAALIAAGYEHV